MARDAWIARLALLDREGGPRLDTGRPRRFRAATREAWRGRSDAAGARGRAGQLGTRSGTSLRPRRGLKSGSQFVQLVARLPCPVAGLVGRAVGCIGLSLELLHFRLRRLQLALAPGRFFRGFLFAASRLGGWLPLLGLARLFGGPLRLRRRACSRRSGSEEHLESGRLQLRFELPFAQRRAEV